MGGEGLSEWAQVAGRCIPEVSYCGECLEAKLVAVTAVRGIP